MNPASKDTRYGGKKWREVSLRVRRRDVSCYKPGCRRGAQVADHIYPVYIGMSDAEFYDESNLRGACRVHNTYRGVVAAAQREMADDVASQRPFEFLGQRRTHQRPLAVFYSQVVTADYSFRKRAANGAG